MCERKEEESLLARTPTDSQSDGGWYGWLVVAASFLCICVLDGVGYSYGILLPPLLQELGEGRAMLSMAGSLQVGVYGLSSPLVSRLVSRWGERCCCVLGSLLSCTGLLLASMATGMLTLVLSYSLLTGLGFGLMYLPSVVIPSKYFTRRRSLATGVVLCAAGVGTTLLAPLSHTLLTCWGWRAALRGLALTCAACVMCGAVMVTPPTSTRPSTTTSSSVMEMDSSALSVFLVLGLADMLSTLSLYMPFTHLPSAVVARGLSSSQAAVLISSVGVSSSLGRLAAGWVSDQDWLHPQATLALAITAATPCIFLLACLDQFPLLLTLCVCFGLMTGIWVSSIPPALIRLLGLPSLSAGFGLLSFSRGTAAIAGPPLAGLVVDVLQDLDMALVVAGAVMATSSLFFTISAMAAKRNEVRRLYSQI